MPADLRSAFPVLERVAYLNTGSIGPVPRTAVEAARSELDRQLEQGRAAGEQMERWVSQAEKLRGRVAGLLRCDASEVALTGATTDGVNAVIAGLDLRPGDELLTSDQEHPGLLAPLASARERRGVVVRMVPFAALPGEVSERTRLVACSHVSWHTGQQMDTAALAGTGAEVLLDGAQGLGAVPVDVAALGCHYYAASGQKWLCGPVGSGYLYVRADRIEGLAPAAPGYQSLADPVHPLELELKAGAARFDGGLPPTHHTVWALAALDTLAAAGMDAVTERAARLAGRLAGALGERGFAVAPRGATTLVSWEVEEPAAESSRLLQAGFLVRHLPGTPLVRASVGAWSSEEEIDRLAVVATSAS